MSDKDELERQRFEAAIRDEFGCLVDLSICGNRDDEYFAWDAQVAWSAWQAALKSKQEEA